MGWMRVLETLLNIGPIIVGFGVLIFFHEMGHYLAAKWAGIRTEAFAIGMGPVIVAWRKGIGFRARSTQGAYQQRMLAHLRERGVVSADEDAKSVRLTTSQLVQAENELGIGETEWSLRWVPIGGFVKMLGQEDANPNAVSDHPRSYNRAPVGKRMVVVSAGVIMNILLAIGLFVVVFMVGVKFEAPVIGDVLSTSPGGKTFADNAETLGITNPGLKPGDVVTHIDGKPARTFADLQIATAMSRPDESLHLTVQRSGFAEPLRFTLQPKMDSASGLLSIGVGAGASTQLWNSDEPSLREELERSGMWAAGIRPGMKLVAAAGQAVSTFQEVRNLIREAGGESIETEWSAVDEKGELVGERMRWLLPPAPRFQELRSVHLSEDGSRTSELGLFGLTPLIRIESVARRSQNHGILQDGDIVLRVGSVESPRMQEFRDEIRRHKGKSIRMVVRRDGDEVSVMGQVDRKGLLNVVPGWALDQPQIARPMERVAVEARDAVHDDEIVEPSVETAATPAAELKLLGRTRINAVNGFEVTDWNTFRTGLMRATAEAFAAGMGAAVELTVSHPTPGRPIEVIQFNLNANEVAELHELKWTAAIAGGMFEPLQTTLTANGNPVRAVVMGFEETWKNMLLVYLTIDRLARGTVGVEQLRGPVGIVHIGTKIADKGFVFLIFFLAMISVNLAVVNFLPLPIVDGGLFLFLLYEKFKGQPPSIAFQNAATVVGLLIIGTLFMVTFYNDLMRLVM